MWTWGRRQDYEQVSNSTGTEEAPPQQVSSMSCSRSHKLTQVLWTILGLFAVLCAIAGVFVVLQHDKTHHAIRSWPRFYGSTPAAVQTPISDDNPLWMNNIDSELSARLEREVPLVSTPQTSSEFQAACTLFDEFVSSLGVNGIIDAVSRAHEKDGDDDPNLDHLLGVWSMETSLRRWGSSRPAIEVAASFKLGSAPLHAGIWLAVTNYHTTSPAALWEHALHDLCFFGGLSLDLLVGCLHGFGHGAFFAAATATSHTVDPSASVLAVKAVLTCSTEHKLNITSATLAVARRICNGGSNRQLR